MAVHTITRMGAAELQLENSIKLFFKKGDPFIIHVLSQNAHEVIKSAAKSLGFAPAYEEAMEIMAKNYGASYVNNIKSLFKFNDKPGKSAAENLKILATVVNNKQRNMLKHSESDELDEEIELNDYQNILCIMDAVMLLKNYKNMSNPSWGLKDNPWYNTFYLFFIEIGQYCNKSEMEKFSVNDMVDYFIWFLNKK